MGPLSNSASLLLNFGLLFILFVNIEAFKISVLNGNNLTGNILGAGEKVCRQEKHRPQLHFSLESNWLNDPNGMVYYEGEYHLHYQYHPYSTGWGPMHWGHAVSTDLVTWTDLPTALYPDDLGTIFSGSAVVDYRNSSGFQVDPQVHPIVAIFTHSGQSQQQSIAYSVDKGRTYTKYAGNPVLPNPGIPDFRDPKVIQYNDRWILVLAAGNKVMFYGSDDLKQWEYLSEFGAEPSHGAHSGVWECPDLLRMEYQGFVYYVLLVSINPGGPNGGSVTQYFVGDFDGRHFTTSQAPDPLWMDWGVDNYASVSFFADPLSRSNVMGWMNNWAYADRLPTGDFRGQMTFPRILNLARPDGQLRLHSSFAAELSQLAIPSQSYRSDSHRDLSPESRYRLSDDMGFNTPLMLVDLVFNIADLRGSSSLAICFLNEAAQELCVGFDNEREKNKEIFLNRDLTGDLGAISSSFYGRPTAARVLSDGIISFSVLLDVSAIELLVDGGLTALTATFFPDQPLTHIELRHHAADPESRLTLLSASVNGLKSIYDC